MRLVVVAVNLDGILILWKINLFNEIRNPCSDGTKAMLPVVAVVAVVAVVTGTTTAMGAKEMHNLKKRNLMRVDGIPILLKIDLSHRLLPLCHQRRHNLNPEAVLGKVGRVEEVGHAVVPEKTTIIAHKYQLLI